MNSLRGRQLVSSFAIIMASILMLALLLFYFTRQQELEKQQEELREIGFDLLGYFNFNKGAFEVDPSSHEDLMKFLAKEGFEDTLRDSSAYLQATETSLIHWHTLAPDENLSSPKFSEIKDVIISFPILAKPGLSVIDELAPEPDKEDKDTELEMEHDKSYIVYAYGFQHSPYGGYQLVIARSAQELQNSTQAMMTNLIYLFIASALLVLFAQLASSYWVISPIRDFDEEIKRIESGNQETIANHYPEELTPIKGTINTLIQYEVGQKRRYRDALDDLAHSLKTPLAAIQGYLEQVDKVKGNLNAETASQVDGISNQLENMKGIVSYQLKKAVVTNHHALITPNSIRPILTRLRESLLKVHHEKNFSIEIKVESNIKVRIDEDDLLELFGNLIHNACRFCENIVEVNAQHDGNMVIINIDDDGMGFPDNNPSKLLQRGIRADSKTEGQGIGLAVCTEIVEAAGGKIELLVSPQVGARVRVRLPS